MILAVSYEEHLLIDGFNVIHAWPEVKREFGAGSEVTRRKLADSVRILHDFEQIRTTLVFDGRGDNLDIEHPTGDPTFSIVYAPAAATADAVIEQYVHNSKNPRKIIVATRDHMIGESVRVSGARVITPEDLRDRIRACQLQQTETLKRRHQKIEKEWKKRKG